jgi:hypothetical protein
MEEFQRIKAQEKTKKKVDTWERLLDYYPEMRNLEIDEEDREEAERNKVCGDLDVENPYLTISAPFDDQDILMLQVPKGCEWAYFVAFMDSRLGEDEWVAGVLEGGAIIPWSKADFVPKKFQLIQVLTALEIHRDFVWPSIPTIPFKTDKEDTQVDEAQKSETPRKEEKEIGTQKQILYGRAIEKPSSNSDKTSQVTQRFDFVPEQVYQALRARPKGRTRKKWVIITLADAFQPRMGGKTVPLQEMQIKEQKPLLVAEMHPPGKSEEEGRSVRFKQAKSAIETWTMAEDFKKRRGKAWLMSQQLPYEDHLTISMASPVEEIKYEEMPCLQIVEEPEEDPDLKKDREILGESWENEFTCNVPVRKANVLRCTPLRHGHR